MTPSRPVSAALATGLVVAVLESLLTMGSDTKVQCMLHPLALLSWPVICFHIETYCPGGPGCMRDVVDAGGSPPR